MRRRHPGADPFGAQRAPLRGACSTGLAFAKAACGASPHRLRRRSYFVETVSLSGDSEALIEMRRRQSEGLRPLWTNHH